jgi:AcrR family transcriptional regulator
MRSTNMEPRPYRMSRRAAQVDDTRRRITEAAVRLHTTVGPAQASIAAVAEAAGVTRLTVYRHFADLDAIFVACMAHWAAEHPWPDPTGWADVADPEARARRGFEELYAFYRANAADLEPIHRDSAAVPASALAAAADRRQGFADAILGSPSGAGSPAARRTRRAAARHLVDFRTWHSLAVEHGLGPREVVDLAVRIVTA